MDLEKLGKLIDQWKAPLAGITALVVTIVGVRKALVDFGFAIVVVGRGRGCGCINRGAGNNLRSRSQGACLSPDRP
jgi:hypothetical protein